MKLEFYLAGLKSRVDNRLNRYLPATMSYPPVLHRAMCYSVFSGGKRIRPILAIESCKACGGDTSEVMPAACAIELVHNYSLIHDDLPAMDNDDYRRGKPTSHKKFGEANAVLAGDGLLTLAFNILARQVNPKFGLQVIEELSRATGTHGMIGGQAVDIESKNKRKDKKRRDYINFHKTASLFGASTKIGAIVAGATKRKIRALSRFGCLLGISFQLIDDIIDRRPCYGAFERDMRRDAEDYVRQAKRCLNILGAGADTLRDIGNYLLTRKS